MLVPALFLDAVCTPCFGSWMVATLAFASSAAVAMTYNGNNVLSLALDITIASPFLPVGVPAGATSFSVSPALPASKQLSQAVAAHARWLRVLHALVCPCAGLLFNTATGAISGRAIAMGN